MIQNEEVVASAKWASIISHVKANRIEYLLVLGLLHIAGITAKAYEQVNGMCI